MNVYANFDFYTYFLDRHCSYDGEPIPDQVHKLRIYCPRQVMPDGTIKDCKEANKAERRKERNEPYKRIADFHKDTTRKIRSMLRVKKTRIVTEDEFEAWGINIYRAVEIEFDEHLNRIHHFIGYSISECGNLTYKIRKCNKFL